MTKTMKINLQHISVRSTHALDSWIERQLFSLGSLRQIDEARIRLVRRPDANPAYEVAVHLVTPGPDFSAAGREHTVRAAISKVMAELKQRITGRVLQRKLRHKGRLSTRRET